MTTPIAPPSAPKPDQSANPAIGIDLASGHDHTAVTLMDPPIAWIDVLAERQRQVTGEGWTPEYDDQHARGEMAQAAGAYAMASTLYHADPYSGVLSIWPWSRSWLKPTNPRRDLVKAAALILAEIERLDRADLRHTDATILHAEQQAEAAAERAVEDRADG